LVPPPSFACGDGRWDDGELCDSAIAPGEAGACPAECLQVDACRPQVLIGVGCQRHCLSTSVVSARNNDGCCPEGAGPGDDSDCGSCGDSIIGPAEACDPPESCPGRRACTATAVCISAAYSGSAEACTARCELSPINDCRDGDGCCPDGCAPGNDDDCSSSCGDGVVGDDETCEDASATTCSEPCEAGASCMSALATGSADNCNTACVHSPITEAIDDDDCCPPGAHAQNDSDCAPSCGNGVAEPGEKCDGDTFCGDNCRPLNQRERCVVIEDARMSVCSECTCLHCMEETLDCLSSGDAQRDADCRAVSDCALAAKCFGDACYCGDSPDCAYPNGPCRSVIQAAARSRELTVAQCQDDPDCATYWVQRYGDCKRRNCEAECAR
jgi:hypothetical protein